jgi:maltooligosyltrehalose trehalohydrolase
VGDVDHPMQAEHRGVFETTLTSASEGSDYWFVLDGAQRLPDPASRFQPYGVHGASRVVDPSTFAWTDTEWRGIPMREYVIYELHVGTFTPAGTFEAIIPHLDALRSLGITAVELMPVGQFPGDRNWGYDGTFIYAPQNSYGGPAGLRTLVNAAHKAGLAVILDVVYNHLGPEGNYLDAFAPYFTDVYHTPWGSAINYDGPDSGAVRRYFIDNALYWISEFHVDGLRLDAIHGIYDFGAHHVLAQLTTEAHALAETLDRTVCIIAESDLNDPRVVRHTADGGLGFDAQWSDDMHHAIHSALTGESNGYYSDFGGTGPVAAAFGEPFVAPDCYSEYRRRRHGASAAGIPRDRFVVSIQNHDQVGNRATGDRLSTLLPPDKLRLAAALLLLSPYVPMLFMGEEYGETRPFNYFVSHSDPALIEAVRKGRRAEFASFGWAEAVPDPASEATFAASRLDRAEADDPHHAPLLALYRDLLALRHSEPALVPSAADIRVTGGAEADDCIANECGGWFVVEFSPRSGDSRVLAAVFNMAPADRDIPLPAASRRWTRLFCTDDAGYLRPDEVAHSEPVFGDHGNSISLAGNSAVLLASERT